MTSRSRITRGGWLGVGSAIALTVLVTWFWSGGIAAQSPRSAIGFTAEQAERGEAAYAEHCASCHGQNLDDGAFAPPLSGMAFRQKWDAQSPETLVTQTRTMPPARPGSLSDEIYADLTAFILRQNGVRAGAPWSPTPHSNSSRSQGYTSSTSPISTSSNSCQKR